jgi:hypothetical protein
MRRRRSQLTISGMALSLAFCVSEKLAYFSKPFVFSSFRVQTEFAGLMSFVFIFLIDTGTDIWYSFSR